MLVRADRSVGILRFAQDDTHWCLHFHRSKLVENYHSPSFLSFLILRLIRSRFSMLRC